MMKINFFAFIVFFMIACAEQVPPSNTTQDNTQRKTNEFEINGTWMSPCQPGSIEFVQSHVTFNNGTYQHRIQFHPDASCQTLFKSPKTLEGTYSTGNQITTSDGVLARELDYHINENGSVLNIPDIYLLRDGVLYLGPQSSGRPSSLDFNYPYVRQN